MKGRTTNKDNLLNFAQHHIIFMLSYPIKKGKYEELLLYLCIFRRNNSYIVCSGCNRPFLGPKAPKQGLVLSNVIVIILGVVVVIRGNAGAGLCC